MNAQKQKRLEDKGWTVGDAADFLELSPEEETLVDTGLALSRLLRASREARGLTSQELEVKARINSGEIARLEGAIGTRFEEVFHVLYILGVSPREIANAISQVELKEAAGI